MLQMQQVKEKAAWLGWRIAFNLLYGLFGTPFILVGLLYQAAATAFEAGRYVANVVLRKGM